VFPSSITASAGRKESLVLGDPTSVWKSFWFVPGHPCTTLGFSLPHYPGKRKNCIDPLRKLCRRCEAGIC